MNPLVSIIIPVYNGANYLGEAIDSALAQTYKNIEIIVVNDGSCDDGETEKVALSYGDKIRYIAKENGGVSTALNRGIAEMKGEYFSWLSHDDLYLPNKIEKQVSLLESEKDIILCSGSLMHADQTPLPHRTKTLSKTLNGRQLFKEHIHGYTLNGLGFLIPKSVFEHVGNFDENMRYLQDFDMWLRMFWYDYRFICHADMLVVSRVHRMQTTNLRSADFKKDGNAYPKKHIALLKTTEVCDRKDLLSVYYIAFVNGNHPEEAAEIKAMLKEDGAFDLALRIKGVWFKYRGKIRRSLKSIRNKLRNPRKNK